MKRVFLILAVLVSAICVADEVGVAPINPAFLKWMARKEKREKAASTPTNRVKRSLSLLSVTNASQANGDDLDFGYVPEVADTSYLANINNGALRAIRSEAFPARYDPRTTGRLTPVKDQGAYGTCWAFATMASIESWLLISEGKTFDFSENNLVNLHGFDWSFSYGGNASMSSAYLLRWLGPVLESQDPYPNPGGSVALTPARHVQRIRWVAGKSSNLDNDDIKDAIVKYGALFVLYRHEFSAAYYNSTSKGYYHPNATDGNHAVAVVGWDDNFPRENFSTRPAGDGAYIVRNSWGTSWGENGYFYVSYYDSLFARRTMYAFCSAEETSNFSRIYQYDTYGYVRSYYAANSATAYGAAIFNAIGSEMISAVGFYALSPETAYTIQVRTGVTAGDPGSGTLALTQSGSSGDAGYITVPLSEPVPVSTGSRFAIVTKLTTPSYSFPLAVETLVSGYTSAATASAGQTFISANGTSWTDFTVLDPSASFCLKAYAKTGFTSKKLTGINCYPADTKVASGKSKTFSCRAVYSDGSEMSVTPVWSVTSGNAYGSISPAGVFTAARVSGEQTVGIRVSYTEGGVTKTCSFSVTITVTAPSVPTGVSLAGNPESSCVRLTWTAVTGATGYSVYRATGRGAKSSSARLIDQVDQPKYADTSATPGVDYTYFIKAKNGSGSSEFSVGVSGWRALAAPSGLAASDGTSTAFIKINWCESPGASYYRIYRGIDDENMLPLGNWSSGLSYIDTSAQPGKLYYYGVKAALDASGTRASELSICDTGVRARENVPESLSITGPAALASGAQGSFVATVRWTDGTTSSCTPTWTCEGRSATASSFAYTAPVVSASKTVELVALATVEYVTMSMEMVTIHKVNMTAKQGITVTPTKPGAPTAPTIMGEAASGITLSWAAVAGASSYVIYRGATSAASAAMKIGTSTGTSYTDTSVVPGQVVYYFIAAVNTMGTSALSPASSSAVCSLAAPTGVLASGAYTDRVRVTWDPVPGATHYRVSRATSLSGSQTDLGSWQTGTTYDDTTAVAGTSYYYFVRAAMSSSGANVGAKSGGVAGLCKKVIVIATLSSLAVVGPSRVTAGTTAAYVAKAIYSDGTTKTIAPTWSLMSASGATIDAHGKLTAESLTADAMVTVRASYSEGGKSTTASCDVVIVASILNTASVSNVTARSRWPWAPIIDIDFTLETSPVGTKADISVEATDGDGRNAFIAQALGGDVECVSAGTHRVSWNIADDNPEFATTMLDIDVKACVSNPSQLTSVYIAIDLSGGVDAQYYPVAELDSPPAGGWTDEYKTSKLVLRRIEPGTYLMGSPTDEVGRSYAEDLHQVTLTRVYYVGVFEVTQRQWELVMGTRPSCFANASCYAMRPVECVSYDDIRGVSAGVGWPNSCDVDLESFLGKIRTKTSFMTFDLPTEAEWEYACRAGTTTALNCGMNVVKEIGADDSLDAVARYQYNGGKTTASTVDTSGGTATVGSYHPNSWGLYDMHGNVSEWCLDWYRDYLGSFAVTDPVGASSGDVRVHRGGDWYSNGRTCRSAFRTYNLSSGVDHGQGFRLALRGVTIDAERILVSFDANGGIMAGSSFVYKQGEKFASLPVAMRNGYIFSGWYTAATGGILVTDNTIAMKSITKLYAHWELPASRYVVIDLSGGTGSSDYPIELLDAEPTGGWSDEYRTSKLVLRRIEPGTFKMGSPSDEQGRWPSGEDLHTVTLTKIYYIGVFEVTQRQWELVMGSRPSYFSNSSCYATRPVEQVSYDMIRGSIKGNGWPQSSAVDDSSFIGKIREKTGLTMLDLPTEAEWEYACRAGTTTALNNGENLSSWYDQQNAQMSLLGRFYDNGGAEGDDACEADASVGTAKVGSYAPNSWGLYDMHGNVEEWCLDWKMENLGTAAVIDPVGALSEDSAQYGCRVQRGGSCIDGPWNCRSACRGLESASTEAYTCGFRLSLRK